MTKKKPKQEDTKSQWEKDQEWNEKVKQIGQGLARQWREESEEEKPGPSPEDPTGQKGKPAKESRPPQV